MEFGHPDQRLAGQPGKNTGPDEVSLGFREHGQLTTLARIDGPYLSTEVAGGFTGRVIGLAATSGSVIIERFEYNHRD
ncbi:hypothetical protein [Arthrobacter sp. B1I2]|uniref:beta-xylosidase family glycoside hydrolase n=1 Tax=Arthrobacter sp. B1I2 TaxID=3042263 RepID=UPI0035943495